METDKEPPSSSPSTFEESPLATTTCGVIKGLKNTSVYDDIFYSFERIPFAQPPLGELRFKAPVPMEPWPGVLDCTVRPDKPAQRSFRTERIEGSEDCLYLSVFVKTFESPKPLPLMVHLFGGGFERGCPNRDAQGPDYFMMKDVVVVLVGYRLGPLGFLSLPDPDVNVPGNAGLRDIILALKWIRENALNFNGDPKNVTLFGESAGSAAVHYLLSSPAAEGLFHKAIMMSGTMLCPWAITPLTDVHARLARAVGMPIHSSDKQILEHLQRLRVEYVLKPQLVTKEEQLNDVLANCVPLVEPYVNEDTVIAKPPEELMESAWGNHIPLLIGGCSFEGLLVYERLQMSAVLLDVMNYQNQHLLPASVKRRHPMAKQVELGARLRRIHFGQNSISKHNILQFCAFASYKLFWHPIVRSVRARLRHSTSPTYLYRFDFDSAQFNHERIKNCGPTVRGVAHADDHSYLWYGTSAWKLPLDSAEFRTIQRMVGMWTSFATTGDPNCQEIAPVHWKPVEPTRDLHCLNISYDLQMIDLPEGEKLKVWDQIYEESSARKNMDVLKIYRIIINALIIVFLIGLIILRLVRID